MATAIVFVQRCIIMLAILLCYFHVQSESWDCELFPFHQMCRGTMSRKRAVLPITDIPECQGNEGNLNCIKEFEEKHRIPYIPQPKSKLLVVLLGNDLPKDVIRSARHKLRNDEADQRKSNLEYFFSGIESPNNY